MTGYGVYRIRVSALVRDADGRFLMVRHARRGRSYWTLPGGVAKYRESIADALVREVREECGLTVRSGAIVFAFERDPSLTEVRRFEVVFDCEVVASVHEDRPPHDRIDEVGWFAPETVADAFQPLALLVALQARHAPGEYLGEVTSDNGEMAES